MTDFADRPSCSRPQEHPKRDDLRATHELLERALVLYLKQDDEEKARLLRTLLLNCKIVGEKLDPVYKKPFDLVAIGVETGNWRPQGDLNPCRRDESPVS